jgi:ATP/maltotriose-dependent transcriptional regulator MalT
MLLAIALQGLGIALLTTGQATGATEVLRRAVDDARDHGGIRLEEAAALSHLARAHAVAGEHDAARRVAEEALSAAKEQEAPVRECLALLTRAHVLRVTQGAAATTAVEADIAAGLALATQVGARTYEPFLHEERGRLTGERDELHAALRGFTAMGATGHARRFEAELGVSPPARTG